MPVRKIPKNYRNVTGIAARSKAVGQAMFESTLERDFLNLLEFESYVASFEVQPVSIIWLDSENRSRRYTPDVLVFFKGAPRKPVLYEVKYRRELKEKWPVLKPKFKAAVRYAREKNWLFKIMTEKEVLGQKLENIKFLLPYIRRGPLSEGDMDILDSALLALRQSTPAQLLESVYQDEWSRARLLPTLWYLIGTHQIGFDIDEKLTMQTPIWSIRP